MRFCSKTPTRHAPHANFSNQNCSSPSEEQRTNLLKNKQKQKFLPLFHPGFLKALDHVLIFSHYLANQTHPFSLSGQSGRRKTRNGIWSALFLTVCSRICLKPPRFPSLSHQPIRSHHKTSLDAKDFEFWSRIVGTRSIDHIIHLQISIDATSTIVIECQTTFQKQRNQERERER